MDSSNGIPGKIPERPVEAEPPEPASRLEPPPPEDRLIRVLRRVPMYAFIVFLGFVAVDFFFPGVKVVVHNAGPGAMRNVTLAVKDRTLALEPIAEGQEASARVRLLGDATLYVNYTDEHDKPQQVDAGVFRFTRMSGTLPVRIKNGAVEENEKP